MSKFIVLLQKDPKPCWISCWKNNGTYHGRTMCIESAMQFKTRKAAEKQLEMTRRIEDKPFSRAEIIEVE